MTTSVPLIDDDFEAAEEALHLRQDQPAPESRQAVVEALARLHAGEGDSSFRLLTGLRPAYNQHERLYLNWFRDKLSWEEFRSANRAFKASPLDEEILRALETSSDEQLGFYSKFLVAAHSAVHDRDASERWEYWECKASRYAAEMCKKVGIPPVKLGQITDFTMECRLAYGLRPPVLMEHSAPTAWMLKVIVLQNARDNWQANLELAQRSRTLREYREATTASRLFEKVVRPKLPAPNILGTLLSEEMALARYCLRQRSQACASPPSTYPPTEAAGGSSAPQNRSGTEKPVSQTRRVRLRRWAIGLAGDSTWRLFHQIKGKWRPRAKVRIPKGNPTLIMKVFAEHDGCVSIHEALQPFRRSYEGKLEAALRRVVTDALAKAKLPIREAIARHLRVDLEDVPNPIPPSDQSWQSKIQIGYAVRDDDNHWMFKLKSEL